MSQSILPHGSICLSLMKISKAPNILVLATIRIRRKMNDSFLILTLYRTISIFNERNLSKTLWEKEKIIEIHEL